MRKLACICSVFVFSVSGVRAATEGDAIRLPSGETAQLQEVIDETSGDVAVARFRFVAPWVAGHPDYPQVASDMEALCQDFAVPRIADLDSQPSRIVISLAQEETEFGVASPEITQFFESYSLSDDLCIWEPF